MPRPEHGTAHRVFATARNQKESRGSNLQWFVDLVRRFLLSERIFVPAHIGVLNSL